MRKQRRFSAGRGAVMRNAVTVGALAFASVGCAEAGNGDKRDASPDRPPVQASDFVIVVTGDRATRRIGAYRYWRAGRDYARAVKVFGRAASMGTDNPLESNLCTVRWRTLGLDMGFATSAPRPCTPAKLPRGGWFGATVHTRRWLTDKGLRVGDRESRVRALYPNAKFKDVPPRPPFWSLVRERRAEFGELDTLTAEVWGGVVVALRVPPAYVS